MFGFTLTMNLNLYSGSGSRVWLNRTSNIVFGFGFEHCSECSEPDRGQSNSRVVIRALLSLSSLPSVYRLFHHAAFLYLFCRSITFTWIFWQDSCQKLWVINLHKFLTDLFFFFYSMRTHDVYSELFLSNYTQSLLVNNLVPFSFVLKKIYSMRTHNISPRLFVSNDTHSLWVNKLVPSLFA